MIFSGIGFTKNDSLELQRWFTWQELRKLLVTEYLYRVINKWMRDIPKPATKTATIAHPTLIFSPALEPGKVARGEDVDVVVPKPVEAAVPLLVLLDATRVLLLHEMEGGARTGAEVATAGAGVTEAAEVIWVTPGQLVTAVPHEIMVTILVL